MTVAARCHPWAAVAALCLALAACATKEAAPVASTPLAAVSTAEVAAPAPVPPAPTLPPREHVRRAVELLGRGEAQTARDELVLALAAQPNNPTARSLLDQIDRDPKLLLGSRNYPYKVRAGETLSELAARFLGDPLLFYALARYNGIERPDETEVGRTLLIPGAPKPAAPAAPAAVARPATDPARASSLRRSALEAMNKGGIDQAVALLQQAAPLDPGNALIRADLQRALRVQQTVRRR